MDIRAKTDSDRRRIRHLASVLPLFTEKYYSFIFGDDEENSQELIQFYNVSIPYPYSHGRYEYPWRLDDPYPTLNQLVQNAKMYLPEYDPEEIISYCIDASWAQFTFKYFDLFVNNQVHFQHDQPCTIMCPYTQEVLRWNTLALAPLVFCPYDWKPKLEIFVEIPEEVQGA